MAKKLGLGKAKRLRLNADFQDIRQNGKSYRCSYFALHARLRTTDSGRAATRMGVSAARRVGNAVERNRAKRRIRELFRVRQVDLNPAADMIVSLRRPIVQADFPKIEQRFHQAIKYCQLLTPEAASRPAS